MPDEANAEQIRYWNQHAGPAWVRNQERLDRQIAPHGEIALEAAAPCAGERALDVGCGCGATTLALAERVGGDGAATGLDVSAVMLERARARAAEAGVSHVAFRQADAQRADLPAAAYDLVFSRFGVMFFDDPGAAFANLRRALAPGGRLVFVCWQPPQRNPWVTVPMAAVAPLLALPEPPAPDAPGMFSFGDRDRVAHLLEGAGFRGVGLDPVDVPMQLGALEGVAEAVRFFLEVGPVSRLLEDQHADAALTAKVQDALTEALTPHVGPDTEGLASAMWLAHATNP